MATEVVQAKPSTTEHTRGGISYCPTVDIVEKPDELLVFADMPGADASNIDVRFENGLLTIHGKVAPRQTSETCFLLEEYGVGDFYRTFQVSETIDASRISAEYVDGVLTLHLPKVASAKPQKVTVQG